MSGYRTVVLLSCLGCVTTAIANDERAAAIEVVRKDAQVCKASPNQEIGFEVRSVPGKPASEPATPEELARVKGLLEKSGMPYDPVNHRASFEFVLALVRTKNVPVFTVSPKNTAESAQALECLTKFAQEAGLDAQFE